MVPAAAVEVSTLTKRFGRLAAVNDLSIAVAPGEVYALLGPNGSGKTTTLRCVLGYVRPTSGRIVVLGSDPSDPRCRVRVGYLPGDLRLDPRLTASQILRDFARMRARLGRISDIAGTAEHLGVDLSRRFGEMSRGNREKVGLVSAFMHRPDVLILDEPTSGLDPIGQDAVLDLVRDARERGCAVVLSSHVLSEVELVADRVGMLRRGQLVVEDSLANLLTHRSQQLEFRLAHEPPSDVLAGARDLVTADVTGGVARVEVRGSAADVCTRLARFGIVSVRSGTRELDQVFHHYFSDDAASSSGGDRP